MIMARPSFSKRPASSRAMPRARMEKELAFLKRFRNLAMRLARSRPTTVKPSQMPKALRAIRPMRPHWMAPPP
ncbi:MAG TPA: hypothetical protein DD477_09780 [Spirochaetaceae bacterium]|nr:hypothetical protein [Spirochaetaceae bacterium]